MSTAQLRAFVEAFDARFGDAVANDVEIDACDAVDWITEHAAAARSALAQCAPESQP